VPSPVKKPRDLDNLNGPDYLLKSPDPTWGGKLNMGTYREFILHSSPEVVI